MTHRGVEEGAAGETKYRRDEKYSEDGRVFPGGARSGMRRVESDQEVQEQNGTP